MNPQPSAKVHGVGSASRVVRATLLVALIALLGLGGCVQVVEDLPPVHVPEGDQGPWDDGMDRIWVVQLVSLCPAFCIGDEGNLSQVSVLSDDGRILRVRLGVSREGDLDVPPPLQAWQEELHALDRLHDVGEGWPRLFSHRHVTDVVSARLSPSDAEAVRAVVARALTQAVPPDHEEGWLDCSARGVYVYEEKLHRTSDGCGSTNGRGWSRALDQLDAVWALVPE